MNKGKKTSATAKEFRGLLLRRGFVLEPGGLVLLEVSAASRARPDKGSIDFEYRSTSRRAKLKELKVPVQILGSRR